MGEPKLDPMTLRWSAWALFGEAAENLRCAEQWKDGSPCQRRLEEQGRAEERAAYLLLGQAERIDLQPPSPMLESPASRWMLRELRRRLDESNGRYELSSDTCAWLSVVLEEYERIGVTNG